MSEFEKWCEKECKRCSDVCDGCFGREICFDSEKRAWKAALDWINKETMRLNGEEGYHLIDVFKLSKVIREELNEKF